MNKVETDLIAPSTPEDTALLMMAAKPSQPQRLMGDPGVALENRLSVPSSWILT